MPEEIKEPVSEEVPNPTLGAPESEQKEPEVVPTVPSTEGEVEPKPEAETVTLSKAEADLLKKKAEDFDRSVELKRLAKLEKKEQTPEGQSDPALAEEVRILREKIEAQEANAFNDRLSAAYREFISENPWANDDARFDKIKENFDSAGTESKEQLLSKLKLAAQIAHPVEYEAHTEARIKAKLMTQKAPDSGGGAAPANIIHKDTNEKTQEDKMKEKMAGLLQSHRPVRYNRPKT